MTGISPIVDEPANKLYPTCSIKRVRRTKDNLQEILTACQSIIQEEGTVSLRHLFYRVVSVGLIEKTEPEYRKLSGYTMQWRRDGSIQWSSFVDSTRWYHGVQTFGDLSEALENSKACFRRNLWQSQNIYVEIWTEKEAIAAIAQQAADPFGVHVFPMKGFGSGYSSLYARAVYPVYYQAHGKEVYIYHLGDHDPSGRVLTSPRTESARGGRRMTAGVLQVHSKTLPHLDLIEKVILDELVKYGAGGNCFRGAGIVRSKCNNEGSHVAAIPGYDPRDKKPARMLSLTPPGLNRIV